MKVLKNILINNELKKLGVINGTKKEDSVNDAA